MYLLITANRNYSSWSLRPWVLMTALGIAFDDQIEPFTSPINYDEFRSFSPTGQVPVLLDEGRTVHDSLGITLYLADRHKGSGRPIPMRAPGPGARRPKCTAVFGAAQ